MSIYINHYHLGEIAQSKPWGTWQVTGVGYLDPQEGELAFCDKVLTVNPGVALSNQRHGCRQEIWRIEEGSAIASIGKSAVTLVEYNLNPGDMIYIPCGHWHMIASVGSVPMKFAERQSGTFLDEDDIVRYGDPRGTNLEKFQAIRGEVTQRGLSWPQGMAPRIPGLITADLAGALAPPPCVR